VGYRRALRSDGPVIEKEPMPYPKKENHFERQRVAVIFHGFDNLDNYYSNSALHGGPRTGRDGRYG
jgi:hypothetical protein